MLFFFPARLILIILPVVIAGLVLIVVTATDKGLKMFGRQGVAWFVTSLMIVAAIGIGYGKAVASGPERPAGSMYVQDDANVLSAATENRLADRNSRLLDRYGAAIAVVTCNYGGDDLYNYALRRFEGLGLNGRSFVVVLDIRGDDYWLVQGKDLVRDFSDEDCGYYAWNYMEDYFASGDYNGAVLSLTEMLEAWYGTNFG